MRIGCAYIKAKCGEKKVIPVPSLLVGLVNDYEKKYGIKNGEYLFKNKKGQSFKLKGAEDDER